MTQQFELLIFEEFQEAFVAKATGEYGMALVENAADALAANVGAVVVGVCSREGRVDVVAALGKFDDEPMAGK